MLRGLGLAILLLLEEGCCCCGFGTFSWGGCGASYSPPAPNRSVFQAEGFEPFEPFELHESRCAFPIDSLLGERRFFFVGEPSLTCLPEDSPSILRFVRTPMDQTFRLLGEGGGRLQEFRGRFGRRAVKAMEAALMERRWGDVESLAESFLACKAMPRLVEQAGALALEEGRLGTATRLLWLASRVPEDRATAIALLALVLMRRGFHELIPLLQSELRGGEPGQKVCLGGEPITLSALLERLLIARHASQYATSRGLSVQCGDALKTPPGESDEISAFTHGDRRYSLRLASLDSREAHIYLSCDGFGAPLILILEPRVEGAGTWRSRWAISEDDLILAFEAKAGAVVMAVDAETGVLRWWSYPRIERAHRTRLDDLRLVGGMAIVTLIDDHGTSVGWLEINLITGQSRIGRSRGR